MDVLVCTTIIESGLDMPNANTLIVNQADKFGLTQLYQLRGRVGRGANLAYAYFLYDGGKRLTPIAQKRLRTIYEATELGAGFGIAMKDLEIRGAGTLLGTETERPYHRRRLQPLYPASGRGGRGAESRHGRERKAAAPPPPAHRRFAPRRLYPGELCL